MPLPKEMRTAITNAYEQLCKRVGYEPELAVRSRPRLKIFPRRFSPALPSWTFPAMDIEWAKDGLTGELFIVQARPETVHLIKHQSAVAEVYRFEGKTWTAPWSREAVGAEKTKRWCGGISMAQPVSERGIDYECVEKESPPMIPERVSLKRNLSCCFQTPAMKKRIPCNTKNTAKTRATLFTVLKNHK